MKHFPIFMAVQGKRIVVAGGGDAAVAKLRLLLKTEAVIEVYAGDADDLIRTWAGEGRLRLVPRDAVADDLRDAVLVYAAYEDAVRDADLAAACASVGALVNIVDNLDDSAFITPAIVDRDPVTIAIGTEGAAPVLARAIKADLEERLPTALGTLARVGKLFRPLAERLRPGRARRDFWSDFYFEKGPEVLARHGVDALDGALADLVFDHMAREGRTGHVHLVGAGPGDPDLLTLKARKTLHEADVVIHDQLVSPEVLELARREAIIIETGKKGFGPSFKQEDINALMVEHAKTGAQVVRLKAGDPGVFGRLDEELDALSAADISWSIVPGITAAAAAVAQIGQSFTKRGRNSAVRLMTGHDVNGFAEQDWRSLAAPGEVAAIYMGKRSARFFQGRLLMHGAAPLTPVTIVEKASRTDGQTIETTLAELPSAVDGIEGAAVILYGLAPREAAKVAQHLNTKEQAK
jgi:uroporphyrin-III C-methyltransferase/precorrin-2 dehydrogenase/sirohydrochlorin ferrochelatase